MNMIKYTCKSVPCGVSDGEMTMNETTERKSMEEFRAGSLLTATVKCGEFEKHVNNIDNSDVREMVQAEYYYYSGRHKEAAQILVKYLNSDDLFVRSIAWLTYSFCNLTLGRVDETRKGIEQVTRFIDTFGSQSYDVSMQPMYVFLVNAANTLLDLQLEDVPRLGDYLRYLPEGIRVFGCYVMSFQAYLAGEYHKGTGIVDTCLSFAGEDYVVPTIYLYLAGAMNAMSVDNVSLAKHYFNRAYELAKVDGLFEPIGENHGLLHGLVESCLRKTEKNNYEKIIGITYRFSYGWRRIHNPMTGEDIADTLTTTEFTVAMLAKRGWTNKEIAEYMELNVNTVKSYMANVFAKLGITSRKELTKYMLK